MPKKGKSSKEEEVAAAAESSDDEPPPPKKKASMAAALMDSDDDEKSDDSSKKKKKKEKKDDKDKKDKKEKKDKKKKREPEPLVCEVLKVESIPKRNNLKLCSLEVPPFGTVSVVTNAPNVVVGKKFVVALPGVTTKNGIEVTESKVGGKDSIGMLCGPNELGWATDVLDEKLAVQLDDGVEAGTSIPSYEDAVAAFKARASPAAAAAPPKEEAAGGAKEDDDDAKGGAKKGKKKKKGGAKEDDDEDFDALLAEVAAKEKPKEEPKEPEKQKEEPKEEPEKQKEEPKEEPPETAAASAKAAANKKKKDKKKGGKADDDDDFDAALNDAKEAGGNATAAEPEGVKATQADLEAPAGDAKDEVVDAKTLANRAKKLKDKLKKQKQGGFDMFANDEEKKEDDDAPAKEAAPAAAAKPEPKAKGKAGAKSGVKESAIVKAARERLEEEQKFAEEKAAFDAAEKFRISEEEREEREEEEAKEAERQRKRDKKAEKLAKQKADGSFQTKAEKLRAQRAEELRKMFGLGDDKDDDDANDGAAAKAEKKPEEKKKVMASKLKKKPKKQDDEADDEAKEEERIKKLEESKAQKKQAKTAAAEEDGEDWEVLDEKIEAEKQKKEAEAAAKKAAKEAAKDDSDEEESGSDSDESGSGSDSDSDSSDDIEYRSPIICIMGHVDTGKTKLLDKIRKTNVQEGEAGGITQQIGATFFPDINLLEQTKKVDPDFDLEVPGLLIIDTPGHESFNNLRTRGASLCDMAILVVDIMHGLEPQTVESLELLKKRRCPFIIAMNKIDVCYQWSAKPGTCVREALDRQEQFVRDEFDKRFQSVMLQLNERGLNCALYWENDDPKSTVSIVPTSALTGEGVPDLLYCLIDLTQRLLSSQIEASDEFECTVIEVKNIEGLGTTIDVILKNGALHEGDQIVIAGIMGPIVTTIRALVTPHPMKEMRVKNDYVHHKMIDKSMGVKICAVDLEQAVAGTALLILGPDDDVEELKEEVMEEFDSILNGFQKQTEGVYVKASTLGSLEALLSFLETDMKIPVFDVGIGEVHKKDVKKALVMKEKSHPEYAVILAFDVAVNKEAKIQADKDDVQIMTADIIYHLQEKFKTYMDKVNESKKTQSRAEVVFPCMLQIDKGCVFRKKDPLIVGCDILGGQLRVGTLLCVPEKDAIEIGRVGSIEKDHKPVQVARRGERVCVKIEQNTAQSHITIGRHFEVSNQIYSKITRESIDTLKENFRDEMQKEDWELVKGMKQVFNIQ